MYTEEGLKTAWAHAALSCHFPKIVSGFNEAFVRATVGKIVDEEGLFYDEYHQLCDLTLDKYHAMLERMEEGHEPDVVHGDDAKDPETQRRAAHIRTMIAGKTFKSLSEEMQNRIPFALALDDEIVSAFEYQQNTHKTEIKELLLRELGLNQNDGPA